MSMNVFASPLRRVPGGALTGAVLSTLIASCGPGASPGDPNQGNTRTLEHRPAPARTPATGPVPPPQSAPKPGAAVLLGTYEVKWCGLDAVEPAFEEVVRRVGEVCARQNKELSNAGRFQCGKDSCTLRSTTQTGGPDRMLGISVYASSLGGIGLQISLTPASGPVPDFANDNFYSCMHPSIYASSRLNAREILRAKLWEGRALCGSVPAPNPR